MATRRDDIRNFSIIAHIDHGKSTLADRILENTETRCPPGYGRSAAGQYGSGAGAGHYHQGPGGNICAIMPRTARITPSTSLILPVMWTSTMRYPGRLAACEGAVLVVDASQGIEAQTLANTYLALEHDLEIVPVINKIDLPSRGSGAGRRMRSKMSSVSRRWMPRGSLPRPASMWRRCWSGSSPIFPRPLETSSAPLRALIFDSYYDSYRGVIVYMPSGGRQGKARRPHPHDGYRGRVLGGGGRPHGCHFADPLRRAHLGRWSVISLPASRAWRIPGWVIQSLWQPHRHAEPLPGYRKVNPMVFCGYLSGGRRQVSRSPGRSGKAAAQRCGSVL